LGSDGVPLSYDVRVRMCLGTKWQQAAASVWYCTVAFDAENLELLVQY